MLFRRLLSSTSLASKEESSSSSDPDVTSELISPEDIQNLKRSNSFQMPKPKDQADGFTDLNESTDLSIDPFEVPTIRKSKSLPSILVNGDEWVDNNPNRSKKSVRFSQEEKESTVELKVIQDENNEVVTSSLYDDNSIRSLSSIQLPFDPKIYNSFNNDFQNSFEVKDSPTHQDRKSLFEEVEYEGDETFRFPPSKIKRPTFSRDADVEPRNTMLFEEQQNFDCDSLTASENEAKLQQVINDFKSLSLEKKQDSTESTTKLIETNTMTPMDPISSFNVHHDYEGENTAATSTCANTGELPLSLLTQILEALGLNTNFESLSETNYLASGLLIISEIKGQKLKLKTNDSEILNLKKYLASQKALSEKNNLLLQENEVLRENLHSYEASKLLSTLSTSQYEMEIKNTQNSLDKMAIKYKALEEKFQSQSIENEEYRKELDTVNRIIVENLEDSLEANTSIEGLKILVDKLQISQQSIKQQEFHGSKAEREYFEFKLRDAEEQVEHAQLKLKEEEELKQVIEDNHKFEIDNYNTDISTLKELVVYLEQTIDDYQSTIATLEDELSQSKKNCIEQTEANHEKQKSNKLLTKQLKEINDKYNKSCKRNFELEIKLTKKTKQENSLKEEVKNHLHQVGVLKNSLKNREAINRTNQQELEAKVELIVTLENKVGNLHNKINELIKEKLDSSTDSNFYISRYNELLGIIEDLKSHMEKTTSANERILKSLDLTQLSNNLVIKSYYDLLQICSLELQPMMFKESSSYLKGMTRSFSRQQVFDEEQLPLLNEVNCFIKNALKDLVSSYLINESMLEREIVTKLNIYQQIITDLRGIMTEKLGS